MTVSLVWIMFICYFAVASVSYNYLYKSRKLISYHFGMNIAMTASGVMGIGCGMILAQQFPLQYSTVTIISTLIAVTIGALFGSLVDYQTLITGIASGIMAGIMGPMVGVVADLLLLLFVTILVFVSFTLLCFSLRS